MDFWICTAAFRQSEESFRDREKGFDIISNRAKMYTK